HVCDGGGAANVERPPDCVGVEGERFSCRSRSAVGEYVRQVDDLEGLDQPDEHDCRRRRQDLWERDLPEHLPAVGAVDLGGLEKLYGQALEGRYQNDEDEWRPTAG